MDKLFVGTYIHIYNGNGGEWIRSNATTFICKNRKLLELKMFMYIAKDLPFLEEQYPDKNGDVFDSNEEFYEYFRKGT